MILHKDVKDLTRGEYQAFYRANFGDEGYMQGELARCRHQGFYGRTISIWSDTKRRELLAWALLTPVREYGPLQVTRYTKTQSKYTVELWVKWKHRGKGYGKALMNEVYNYDDRPNVLPHDEISEKFYSNYNVMVMNIDKKWRDN